MVKSVEILQQFIQLKSGMHNLYIFLPFVDEAVINFHIKNFKSISIMNVHTKYHKKDRKRKQQISFLYFLFTFDQFIFVVLYIIKDF